MPKVVKTLFNDKIGKLDTGEFVFKTSSGWSETTFSSGIAAVEAYEDVYGDVYGIPTVTKTQHFDGFQIDTYSDGTFGYMTDGGQHKEGYKSKDGAKKMATKLAAKEPKGPQVLKSEDKGGYVVNTFSDGTYGYLMPDGAFKNGYKSKYGAGEAGKKLAAKAAKAQAEAQVELLEKQAQALSQKLQTVYADAVASMTAKLEKELARFEKAKAEWQADVANGKKTAEQYQAWLKDQSIHNEQIKALKKTLAQDLANTDKMAMAYVNDMPAGVYAEGMNFATYEIEHGAKADLSFTLYDKNTVMELVANEPDLLPQMQLDEGKDLAWNQKHVTSAVTQGVLQGQSIPQLAASIAGIAGMDQRAAMRSARTAMTSAHNLGKIKGYENAAKMGIDVQKRWLATLDKRTRGSHRHLDGEIVKLDEKFSNGLEYPGDPNGSGSEVYNCFLGDVSVDSDSEIVRSYKSLYVGETVTVDTAAGVHFTCTPNHPILTDKGWVPARLLNEGHNLLVTFRSGPRSGPDPDVQHGFASFKAVHELLREFGCERASGLRVNFHGDRPASDVEVVGKEGLLRVCGDVTGIENVDKLLLELTDPSASAGGSVCELPGGCTALRPSDMGGLRDALLLVLGHRGHADVHRLGSVPRSDATVAEDAIDNLPAETMCRRELIGGLSGKVMIDKVISVEVGSTRGSHVYNLQTGDGYYFVSSIIPGMDNGIFAIAKNCRCTMIPVIGDVPYDEVKRASKLGGMTYDEWKNEKLTAEQKKAKSLDDQLKQVDDEMDTLKELMKQEDKTYSGIWKDNVTLADWESKKESIPKKIQYYEEQLAKAAGDDAAVAKWQGFIDMTNEFDTKGQAYKAHIDKMAQLKLQRQSVHKQMVDLGLVEDSAFSEERKANAWRFKTSAEADKHFRDVCGRVWREATQAQRDGIYGYTSSSGAWNRPLSGFQKPWSQGGSGWEKKFYKGVGDVWIDFEGKGSAIRRMTEIIEKSTYDHDTWLVRGCDYNAMDSFFGMSESKLRGMSTEEMREQLAGMSNRISSFVSTGTAAGTGFSSKPVAMEIYAPAGSEMMYAEPFSAFSGASYNGKSWDGEKKQTSFGSESEMILQRGGYYTVTDAYKGSDGKMHIVMELHPEQGYDKFQQDPNEWTGSKKNYRD